MQTLKLRPMYKFTNNNIVRKLTATNPNTKVSTEQDLKSWKDIPGPSSLPIIGQLLHFLPGGSLHAGMGIEFQKRVFERYGPIVRIEGLLGAPAMVFVFDAEVFAQVLRGEDAMPERPGFETLRYYRKVYSRNKDDPIDKPTGIITENGEAWKSFRSMVNPILLTPKTINLYTKALDDVALDMVARLKSIREDHTRIQNSFDAEMNLWALEATCVIALGGRLNSLDPNLPHDSPVRKLIKVINEALTSLNELDFKPNLSKYIWTPAFKRAMNVYEEQKILSKNFIRQAIKEIQSKSRESNDEKSVLEKLSDIDEDVGVIMAVDMILAGTDPTAQVLITILHLLATNPEKQKKLREEIMSKQERRPYLQACIKEALRMRPFLSFNMRKLTKDYNIMGYRIPKDMHVMTSNHYLSLLDDQYPRSQEYIPERWIVDKDDPLYHGNAQPFVFAPFGYGSRSCIGRRIAELEMKTLLTRMFENFQVEWVGPPPNINTTLMNVTAPPYNFVFKDV